MKKILLAIGVCTFLAAAPASAATLIFDVCDVGSLCNQLSFQTTLTAGSIDVHVSATGDYGLFGDSGANRALGFNVVGSTAGLSITGVTPGFEVGGTNGQVNGYGFFEYFIDGPHGGSGAFQPLDFTVSRTGGFLSDMDLFESNSAGFIIAAHLRDNRTGVTGFVAADGVPTNPSSPVPEPTTMILLGTGLLAAFRAKRG